MHGGVLFFLKKLAGHFLMPLPLLLAVAGLGLLTGWRALRCFSRLCLATGLIGLCALSLEPVSNALIRPLEMQYPSLTGVRLEALAAHPPKWIVVLGNGHSKRFGVPALQLLNGTSITRLTEGLRLQHALPGCHLLLSGGSPLSGEAEAPILAKAAIELGAQPDTLKIEDQSLDTADEARNVYPIVGSALFILVTSAVHMPRAMALFRQRGMHPIAAPTGFLGSVSASPLDRYFPESDSLMVSRIAIYEYLGLAFEQVLGYFNHSAEEAI